MRESLSDGRKKQIIFCLKTKGNFSSEKHKATIFPENKLQKAKTNWKFRTVLYNFFYSQYKSSKTFSSWQKQIANFMDQSNRTIF